MEVGSNLNLVASVDIPGLSKVPFDNPGSMELFPTYRASLSS